MDKKNEKYLRENERKKKKKNQKQKPLHQLLKNIRKVKKTQESFSS